MDFFQVALGDLHRVVQAPYCEGISILMAFVCGAIVLPDRPRRALPDGRLVRQLMADLLADGTSERRRGAIPRARCASVRCA